MSNKLFGNADLLTKQYELLEYDFPVEGECPVDIISLRNRKTETSALRKALKELGGFDPRAFDRPTIAVVEETNEEYLYDGDHSRWLYRLYYPNEEKMPCRRVIVKDLAELSRLFVHRNKRGKKDLTAEEIFVHEYLGGFKEAFDLEKHLSSSNLKVSLGTKEANTTVGSMGGKEVPINGFRTALKKSSPKAVYASSVLIQSVWSSDTNVTPELLGGIAIAIDNGKLIGDKKWNDLAKSYLSACSALGWKQKKASKDFKIEGGKVGNQDHNCVALGFLRGFRLWGTNNKSFSDPTFRNHFGTKMNQIKGEIERSKTC
tara:strand:+ start:780 stop:1730 length:951 start_codon:yes stop_codon:yes gene_type:complete